MNVKPTNISLYPKTCRGCKVNGGDMMLALTHKENGETKFIDVFLTKEQAEELAQKLLKESGSVV